MEIQLSERAIATIQERIIAGINKSPDEVIDAAMSILAEQDEEEKAKLAYLRRAVQEGLESGECTPWDPAEVKRVAMEMVARGELD